MQCSCAVLLDVSYDPKSGFAGVNGARTFNAADGYGIEFDDVSRKLTVKHSGRTAVFFEPRIDYVLPLLAVAVPVVVAEPVKTPEPPKPAPVVQQQVQRAPQQFQGKRR